MYSTLGELEVTAQLRTTLMYSSSLCLLQSYKINAKTVNKRKFLLLVLFSDGPGPFLTLFSLTDTVEEV